MTNPLSSFRAMTASQKAFAVLRVATLPITFPFVIPYMFGAGGYLLKQRDATERNRKLVRANINLRAENERLRREQINTERLKVEIALLNGEVESQKQKREDERRSAGREVERFLWLLRDEIAAAEQGKTKRELLSDRIKEHARKALYQIEAEAVEEGNVVRIFKARPTAGELPE